MPRSLAQCLPSLYNRTFIRTPEPTEKAPSWDRPTVPWPLSNLWSALVLNRYVFSPFVCRREAPPCGAMLLTFTKHLLCARPVLEREVQR